jgi:hypothetical protein
MAKQKERSNKQKAHEGGPLHKQIHNLEEGMTEK